MSLKCIYALVKHSKAQFIYLFNQVKYIQSVCHRQQCAYTNKHLYAYQQIKSIFSLRFACRGSKKKRVFKIFPRIEIFISKILHVICNHLKNIPKKLIKNWWCNTSCVHRCLAWVPCISNGAGSEIASVVCIQFPLRIVKIDNIVWSFSHFEVKNLKINEVAAIWIKGFFRLLACF